MNKAFNFDFEEFRNPEFIQFMMTIGEILNKPII